MLGKLDEEVIEAAGGIVEQDSSDGPLIVVIHRERYGGEWGLPKGKRQIDETWQQTALREVEEEIGRRPVIIGIAGATAYLAGGIPKLVLYWRMRVDGHPSPFTPNEEVTEIEWLAPVEAIDRLTHREEANLLHMVFQRSSAR